MCSDKRPYEFVERDEDGVGLTVRKKIPDATMGLRTYTEEQMKGFKCTAEDCTIDHSVMEPHQNLSKRKLLDMTSQRETGLVVDGLWGKADIIFPWAIYEAKKGRIRPENAESQIFMLQEHI